MKKIFFLAVFVLIGLYSKCQVKNDNPNSNWPYLFETFSSCVIIHNDGNVTKAKANYNLLSEEIQFQKNDEIMSITEPEDIKEVSFDDFTIVNLQNNFYLRLNQEGNVIAFYKKIKGNMNDLFENKGAYGSSTTTAATMQQADIDIGGINNMNIRMLWDSKGEGKNFRVNETYYFSNENNNELIPLKKRNLYNSLDRQEKDVKSFIRNEKISLKDDDDLVELANYLSNL